MTKIREQQLTPSEARQLKHQGFILVLIKLLRTDKDLYVVYVN
jgi:hypothetical protein